MCFLTCLEVVRGCPFAVGASNVTVDPKTADPLETEKGKNIFTVTIQIPN